MSEKCSVCANLMADQDMFCGQCGSPRPVPAALAKQPRYCPGCGGQLEAQSRFCRHCGRAVKLPPAGAMPVISTTTKPADDLWLKSAPQPVMKPAKVKRTSRRSSVHRLIAIAAVILVIAVAGYLLNPVFNTLRMKSRAAAADKIFADGITVENTVMPDSKAAVGDLGQSGWALSAQKQTFSEETELFMDVLSYQESQQFTSADGEIIGSVMEITASANGQQIVYLNQPVTISMQIPSSDEYQNDKSANYVAACLLDDEWIYVHPLASDLAKGIITFETDHFTRFAVLSLEEHALVKKLAADYAKREWSKGNAKEQVMARLQMTIRDALASAGIEDEEQQDSIIMGIKQSNKYDSMVTSIEKGEQVDLNKQCAEMTSDTILSRYTVPGAKMLPVMDVGSNLFQGTVEMDRGNYGRALVEYTKALAKAFPPTKMINSAIEGASFTGILARDWDRFSENISYRVFREYIGQNGSATSVNSPEWERVLTELYGSVPQAELEALKQHCQTENVSLDSLSDDREKVRQIFENYSGILKQRYSERYQLENELAGRQAEYSKVVEGMIKSGLLSRGTFAFPVDMDIRDRVDQLFVHRQYILDLFGGTMPVLSLGESSEDNLNEALTYALICRGDTGEFFSWLEEKGYIIKKAAAPTATIAADEPGQSFTAVHESTYNRNYNGRFETGLDQAVKQAGSLAFNYDGGGNLSITIPGAEFEKAASDNDAFEQRFIVDPISISAVPDKDDKNLWGIEPGAFGISVRLIPTNVSDAAENTVDVEYQCTYTGFVRIYDDSPNVVVFLSVEYDTIVNGTAEGEREYNGIELTFSR